MAMTAKTAFMMMIAMITMALTLVLINTTTNNLNPREIKNDKHNSILKTTREEGMIVSRELVKIAPPKRGIIRRSRFLAEKIDHSNRNPRAANHCHKDNEICYVLMEGQNSTCCNNKCMDLSTDTKNCGACKNKCKFTESCCGGQCVNLAYDKRHCGVCNNKCMLGGYCLYGMCDYA